MFVVNDLERLTEYGFEDTGKVNRKNRAIHKKLIGTMRADQSQAVMYLEVNPYNGTHENELVVSCRCRMDADAWDAHEPSIVWPFEEIGQLVRDGVVDWVENAQGSEDCE